MVGQFQVDGFYGIKREAVLRLPVARRGAAAIGRAGIACAFEHPGSFVLPDQAMRGAVRAKALRAVVDWQRWGEATAEARVRDPVAPVDRHQIERVGERGHSLGHQPHTGQQRASGEAQAAQGAKEQ